MGLRRSFLMVLLPLLALACDAADDRQVPPLPPDQATAEAGPARLRFCGVEERAHGGETDAGVRRCVWEAYGRGEPVEFVSRLITDEGDPITTAYTLLGPDRVLVYEDSRDRFGRFGAFRFTCSGVEPDPEQVFRFTGCTEPTPEPGMGATPGPPAQVR